MGGDASGVVTPRVTRRRLGGAVGAAAAGASALGGLWLPPAGGGAGEGSGGAGGATGTIPAATIRYLSDNAGPRGDVFANTIIPAFAAEATRRSRCRTSPSPSANCYPHHGRSGGRHPGRRRARQPALAPHPIPQKIPLLLDDRLKASSVPMKDMGANVLKAWTDPSGKVYGIPDEIAIYATCYAAPLFQQRGIKPPAVPAGRRTTSSPPPASCLPPAEGRWGWYDLPTAGSPLMEGWFAANGGRSSPRTCPPP